MAMADESSLGKAGVLNLNALSYRMPPDLSVAVSRTVTSQWFASQTAAAGSSSMCIWNTGAAYVNARQSSLVFDLKNDSAKAVWFGLHGSSAASVINRITISSRSGQILEKVDRANQLAAIKALYTHDNAWSKTGPGSAMGMVPAIGDLAWAAGAIIRFVIPLGHISPMFDSVDSLLPAQLCSGLKFEVTWETGQNALMSAESEGSLNYSVSNMRFQTESYLLSDLVMRSLNEQSASAGLEVVCTTAFNNQTSRATSLLTTDVGKSVSRALSFIYKEREIITTINRSNLSNFMSVKQTGTDSTSYVNEWQARVGSLYYPQASIRTTPDIGARGACPELYMQTLRAFGKFDQRDTISCSVSEKAYREGDMCIAQDLERSNVQQLSGIPLSQSRTLSITVANTEAVSLKTEIDIYLMFVQLIRVFSSQVVIEI